MVSPVSHRTVARIAIGGFSLAVLAILALIVAGPGYRLGLWDFRPAFTIMRWAAYGGLAAAIFSLLGALGTWLGRMRRGFRLAVVGLLLGLLTAAIPWRWWRAAQRVPPIHDITTDTETPPAFIAILPLRRGAPNTADYGGPEVAAQQRSGYPDLAPLFLPHPPERAFTRALTAAHEMGWNIVAAEPAEGRIEATDTTFWFGFIDDIVVRVRPEKNGSRIDVRSVSRVGRSDIGTNAARITAYLARIAATP
jgi:uncharacterized protein (DUF1499 family)